MAVDPGKLLEERIKKHSTVAIVALELGVTKAHLYAIIAGTGKPGRALAGKLALLFNVSASLWDADDDAAQSIDDGEYHATQQRDDDRAPRKPTHYVSDES